MLSSINHSSPSGNSLSGSVNSSSSSSSLVHVEQEHQDTPSMPSTQKHHITVEDVTDEDDNNVSPRRSPSSDYSFIYYFSSSGSGHTEQGHQDTPSTPSTPNIASLLRISPMKMITMHPLEDHLAHITPTPTLRLVWTHSFHTPTKNLMLKFWAQD